MMHRMPMTAHGTANPCSASAPRSRPDRRARQRGRPTPAQSRRPIPLRRLCSAHRNPEIRDLQVVDTGVELRCGGFCNHSWSQLRDNDVAPSSGQRLRRARSDRVDISQKTKRCRSRDRPLPPRGTSVADPVTEIASFGCSRPHRYGTSAQRGPRTNHFNNEDTE